MTTRLNVTGTQRAWLTELGADLHWLRAAGPRAAVPAQPVASNDGSGPPRAQAAAPGGPVPEKRAVETSVAPEKKRGLEVAQQSMHVAVAAPAVAVPAAFQACADLDAVYDRLRSQYGQDDAALPTGARLVVPGAGVRDRPCYLIVGEQPSLADELARSPFQGDSGQLLAAMLSAVSLPQQDSVYQTYVLKARTEQGRTPQAEEIASSLPCLHREIELLQPQWILALGQVAAQALLGTAVPFADLCGRLHHYALAAGEAVPLWVTASPAALLVRAADKARAWRDLLALANAVRSRDRSDR